MTRPTLYLMLGFPGAGKTTAASVICELTGAVHLWADAERRKRFKTPSFSTTENHALYNELNSVAEKHLAGGKSLVFDTNFSFYRDRQKLRLVAKRNGGEAVVVWVKTGKEIAKKRAVTHAHEHSTRVLGSMPEEAFERMSRNLEPPKPTEKTIELDGTKITKTYVAAALGL